MKLEEKRGHNNNVIIIIICDIYIVSYSARSCSKALYNIIIPDSDLFPPSTYLNSQGSIQCMRPLYAQSITQTQSHHILYGWVNQSPHDSIVAHGASNPRPFGYKSCIKCFEQYQIYFLSVSWRFNVIFMNYVDILLEWVIKPYLMIAVVVYASKIKRCKFCLTSLFSR